MRLYGYTRILLLDQDLAIQRAPREDRAPYRPRGSDSTSHNGAAHIAFDAYDRLGLRDLIDFEAQSYTPADRCVRFAVAVTDNYAILATGRPATALPVPVSHRLERASFA